MGLRQHGVTGARAGHGQEPCTLLGQRTGGGAGNRGSEIPGTGDAGDRMGAVHPAVAQADSAGIHLASVTGYPVATPSNVARGVPCREPNAGRNLSAA